MSSSWTAGCPASALSTRRVPRSSSSRAVISRPRASSGIAPRKRPLTNSFTSLALAASCDAVRACHTVPPSPATSAATRATLAATPDPVAGDEFSGAVKSRIGPRHAPASPPRYRCRSARSASTVA